MRFAVTSDIHGNLSAFIADLIKSKQYEQANIWSKIIIQELRTAREYMCFFLWFADQYANEINDKRRPLMPDTWEKAYDEWRKTNPPLIKNE